MNIVHGGDIYSVRQKVGEEPLDFSANINPLGMPPRRSGGDGCDAAVYALSRSSLQGLA